MHANDNFVEQLLDPSLAAYSAVEPRAGLEQRVLARLADESHPAAWHAWRWVPAGALAIIALLAGVLLSPRKETTAPPVTQVHPAATNLSTPPTPAAPAPVLVAAPAPKVPMFQTNDVTVRAGQFPRPGPLTEEERHLMSYLNAAPKEVLVAAVRSDSNRPLADLLVRDVEVPMLELKPLPEQSGEAMDN
ncbi:MAG: hypothetical protein ACRD2M_04770 [Terriglobales bacterium]